MTEIDARLAAIAERFVAQADENAAAIAVALDSESWSELARLAHSLAGRAGLFGYAGVGDVARSVEEGIEAGLSGEAITGLTRDLLDRLAMLNRS